MRKTRVELPQHILGCITLPPGLQGLMTSFSGLTESSHAALLSALVRHTRSVSMQRITQKKFVDPEVL